VVTKTGLGVVTDALKLIGVVAGHEVPTSAEQQDALARLNELVDAWGTQPDTMWVPRRDVVPLVAGRDVYTIGVGGDFDLDARPLALDAAAYLTTGTPPVEIGLGVPFVQAVIGQPVKSLSGPPQGVSYVALTPLAELTVWPVPTIATDLVLYWREPVAQFPDLVTPVALKEGYARALRWNLALELAPEFGRPVDALILKTAGESLADVKRANVALVEIGIDGALTGCGGGYSILTDS
jgi:hypothetical protein